MYKKSTLIVMVIILSMFFLTSCKKESPTETPVENLIVTVGEDLLQPKYYWTDANGDSTGITRIAVYRIIELDDPLWAIQTISEPVYSSRRDWYADGISPPVTHGVVQEGAEKWGIRDICQLPKDFAYRVVVSKTNGVKGYKDFSR